MTMIEGLFASEESASEAAAPPLRAPGSALSAASALLLSVAAFSVCRWLSKLVVFDNGAFALILLFSPLLWGLAVVASYWSAMWWYLDGTLARLDAARSRQLTFIACGWAGLAAFFWVRLEWNAENLAKKREAPAEFFVTSALLTVAVFGVMVLVGLGLKALARRHCPRIPLAVSVPALVLALIVAMFGPGGVDMEALVLWAVSAVVGGMLLATFDKTTQGVLLGLILGPVGCIIALVWRMNLASNEERRVRFDPPTAPIAAAESDNAPPQSTEPDARRECPYCAEQILRKARFCKHCRQDVEPLT